MQRQPDEFRTELGLAIAFTDAVKNSSFQGPRGDQGQWYRATLTKLLKYHVKATCHLLTHIEIYSHQGD